MSEWVYIQSEPCLFTVGHYDPSGGWHPESDHGSRDEAAERVAYLNGEANAAGLRREIARLDSDVVSLRMALNDAAGRLDFLTNWLEHSYHGGQEDIRLGRSYAQDARDAASKVGGMNQ